jgi:hypothetical protein
MILYGPLPKKVIQCEREDLIHSINMDAAEDEYAGINYSSMAEIISQFGEFPLKACMKLMPCKEKNVRFLRTHVFHCTGNCTLIAVETERLYYVFCYTFTFT